MNRHDRRFWIIWIAFAAAALVLALYLSANPGPVRGEVTVDLWIQKLPLDTVARIGNALAYSPVMITNLIILSVIFVLIHRWWLAAFLLGALAFWPMHLLFKQLVKRPRPTIDYVRVTEHPSSYSFPSGHTFAGTLFFGSLAIIVWKWLPPGKLRTILIVLLIGLIGLIGISRVYVGAHWPTDVVGGWLIAALCLALLARIAVYVNNRYGLLDQKHPPHGG